MLAVLLQRVRGLVEVRGQQADAVGEVRAVALVGLGDRAEVVHASLDVVAAHRHRDDETGDNVVGIERLGDGGLHVPRLPRAWDGAARRDASSLDDRAHGRGLVLDRGT